MSIATTTTPSSRTDLGQRDLSKEREAPRRPTVGERLLNWASDYPQHAWWSALLRCIRPILRLGSTYLILRDEDVREVLTHNKEFPVPWAARMKQLTGNRNFLLGMEDGPEYRLNYLQLTQAFKRSDVPQHVTPLAARTAEAILHGKNRLDAVRDLMWQVPAQLCEDYFGIVAADKLQLAQWSVAMSGFVFGPPSKAVSAQLQTSVMTAATGFRSLIRTSIQMSLAGNATGVVLPRLIQMHRQNPQELPLAVIEAHLFGMVLGFIPTNLLAGGNILETLLRREKFMAHARQAVLTDDDDLLWRCLQETLRFRHINLGPFRTTGPEGYTLAAGTRRERFIPPGSTILAGTQSAMFDGRRVAHPSRFDPQRPTADYLVFGHGQHWCLGAYIAIAQLTQTFKALLRREALRPAAGKEGKMQRLSTFPAHLVVEWRA